MENQERFFRIEVGEFSDQLLEEIWRATYDFTIPLILNDQLVGSGTLVTVEGSRGILTAAHVILRTRQDQYVLPVSWFPLHQAADFEKALVNARSVTTRIFDRPSGGAGHCQMGALTLYRTAVFDWLLEKFPASPRG